MGKRGDARHRDGREAAEKAAGDGLARANADLRRELEESRRQQLAAFDILKVMSRSAFDLQALLDTLTASAATICQADMAGIVREFGSGYRHVTNFNFPEGWLEFNKTLNLRPERASVVGRVLLDGRPHQVADVLADPEYTYREAQRQGGYRTFLGVPLLREGSIIGVIILGRKTVRPFTDHQIELVSSFADQAVIAIENVRLFDELQARSRDLAEALSQQTATAEVLNVISRSPGELQPVLDAIVETARRLCRCDYALVFRNIEDRFHVVAADGADPEFVRFIQQHPIPLAYGTLVGRVGLERRTIYFEDAATDPRYTWHEALRRGGFRSNLGVPLMHKGEVVGVINLFGSAPSMFSENQIRLVETFADQAVIAMENVRLFDELRARTDDLGEALRQQTATAEVLKVISRSTFDLQAVLSTLVESAARLCDADKATITREINGKFYRAEAYGFSQEFLDYARQQPVERDLRTVTGRALLEGQVVHIPDVDADPDYSFDHGRKLDEFRTILGVPMLKEGRAVGVFALTRAEVRPFTQRQIEMVSTFADQAAIAIENSRLFESVQARTRELAQSLEDLRTAQDRLVQTEKLASLGQLTAGIAHEIKNPLNFVNNFSALSIELLEELRQVMADISAGEDKSAEAAEIGEMLRGNLEKILQHGKRADTIIRNMLMHSRSGSGDRRAVNINAIVEEAIGLAYHGARAERPGFSVDLTSALDPAAGEVDIFPQEITRVLLNLITNGFHAAARRRQQESNPKYEPCLTVSTRGLGEEVEIRIRDNGTGIPQDIRDKIFDPFFTTKPPGEGTGLGLSLSHDIVVKQHSGSIAFESVPGEFTEFTIVLPRAGAASSRPGRAG